MAEITKRQEADGAVLTLRGDLTIAHAGKIRAAVLEALAETRAVRVELRDLSDIDVCVLQLFCAAHRSAVRRGATFRIAGSDERLFADVVLRAGFPRTVGCRDMDRGSCLWACGQDGAGHPGASGAGS